MPFYIYIQIILLFDNENMWQTVRVPRDSSMCKCLRNGCMITVRMCNIIRKKCLMLLWFLTAAISLKF